MHPAWALRIYTLFRQPLSKSFPPFPLFLDYKETVNSKQPPFVNWSICLLTCNFIEYSLGIKGRFVQPQFTEFTFLCLWWGRKCPKMGTVRDMNSFGKWLRRTRRGRGITITQLADKTGISTSHISRIENGLTEHPSLPKIQALAKGLGVELDEALIAAEITVPPDAYDKLGLPLIEAIERDRVLPPDIKEMWIAFYKKLLDAEIQKGKPPEQ